jgi:hypothetical protein
VKNKGTLRPSPWAYLIAQGEKTLTGRRNPPKQRGEKHAVTANIAPVRQGLQMVVCVERIGTYSPRIPDKAKQGTGLPARQATAGRDV